MSRVEAQMEALPMEASGGPRLPAEAAVAPSTRRPTLSRRNRMKADRRRRFRSHENPLHAWQNLGEA